MNISGEYKKIKRTGILPGVFAGGILAASIPVLELAVRSEQYTGLVQSPLQTILEADWQMMAMLNMLLVITASCMLYHTEYADHAIQRITTLPIREEAVFIGKFLLMTGLGIAALVMEMLSLIFCTLHWFGGEGGAYETCYGEISAGSYMGFIKDLAADFAYCLGMLIPVILLSLLIASAWKNMWIALGIDVVCVFMATIIPERYFALSIFPFALPFRILEGVSADRAVDYLIAAAAEAMIIGAAETIFMRVRRALA
ncbi:MAG: ABC transporter permease [Lachnospiraceae bacterium]